MAQKHLKLGFYNQVCKPNKSQGKPMEERTYTVYPNYIRGTLEDFQEFKNVRNQEFAQKLFIAELLKGEGNRLYAGKMFEEAFESYHKSLSIFRYLRPKNQRIQRADCTFSGSDVSYETYKPTKKQHIMQLKSFLVLLFTQLAICCSKLFNFSDSLSACDDAIHTDPSYYRPYLIRSKLRLREAPNGRFTLVLSSL
jgi:tetratricopeptide (TPR) repeat protein